MRTLILGLALVSTSAFAQDFAACPNLAGKYAACRDQAGRPGSKDIVITQTLKNGITTYTLASTDASTNERETETFRADGKTVVRSEKDPETGAVFALATTVRCAGNNVIMDMKVTYGNEELSNVTTTVARVGTQLTQVTKGSSMGESVDETMVCE